MSWRTKLWGRLAERRRRTGLIWCCALTAVFIAIGVLIALPAVQQFDLRVSREIQETSGAPWDQIMIFGTFIGSSPVVAGVVVLLGALLWARNLKRIACFVLLTLISLPIDFALKQLWDRARPNSAAVHILLPAPGSSFPSGHALCATTVYGFLAFLAWVHLPDHKGRMLFTALIAALVPYVAISRVYVGAHWLSDVLGAFTIGLLLMLALATFYHADPTEAVRAEQIVQSARCT